MLHNTRRILRENPRMKREYKFAQENGVELDTILEDEIDYKKTRHHKRKASLGPTKAEQREYQEELQEELAKSEIVCDCEEFEELYRREIACDCEEFFEE